MRPQVTHPMEKLSRHHDSALAVLNLLSTFAALFHILFSHLDLLGALLAHVARAMHLLGPYHSFLLPRLNLVEADGAKGHVVQFGSPRRLGRHRVTRRAD